MASVNEACADSSRRENTCFLFGQQNASLKKSVTSKVTGTGYLISFFYCLPSFSDLVEDGLDGSRLASLLPGTAQGQSGKSLRCRLLSKVILLKRSVRMVRSSSTGLSPYANPMAVSSGRREDGDPYSATAPYVVLQHSRYRAPHTLLILPAHTFCTTQQTAYRAPYTPYRTPQAGTESSAARARSEPAVF